MSPQNQKATSSRLRRIVTLAGHWLGLLLAAAAIFDGAVFYFRWNSTREAEHAKTAKEAEDAQKFLKIAGGNELKILAFYASPDILRRGEHTLLCYGVNDAKTVRLEPSVEEVWPSFTRCIQVSPRKDTEYKLTAEDAAGHSVSQSVTIRVGR